jgi:hypothetical protein
MRTSLSNNCFDYKQKKHVNYLLYRSIFQPVSVDPIVFTFGIIHVAYAIGAVAGRGVDARV